MDISLTNSSLIFSDFDGTLTNNGYMGSTFFEILDFIQTKGTELIIVTGRPVTWGYFLLSHTRIKAAITEGGGVLLRKKETGEIEQEILVSEEELKDFQLKVDELKSLFPNLRFSVDTNGRITDRAIELSDIDSEDEKKRIKECILNLGMGYEESNIHAHCKAGDCSKFKATQHYLKTYQEKITLEDCVFFGDSLNDESMFEGMPLSVGVSNIYRFLDRFTFKPKVILTGNDNKGALGVLNYLKKSL